MAKVTECIKLDFDTDCFIWKFPEENFNQKTQLIVHEGQEALFIVDGKIFDKFGPGKYNLNIENLPKLKQWWQKLFGSKEEFHAEVYFISKIENLDIKWGTDHKIEFMEPTYQFPLSIGASGTMLLRVNEGEKLLLKLVGAGNILTKEYITKFFRAFLMTKVKSYIAQTIKSEKISIFEIDEKLEFMSSKLTKLLIPDFLEYGIDLKRFNIMNVVKPDGEAQYEKFKTLHFRQYADVMEAKLRQQVGMIDAQTEAQKTVIESQAFAQKRAQEGYTYQQERGFDVATDVARNNSINPFNNNFNIGLGTIPNMNLNMGDAISNSINGDNVIAQQKCPKCGAILHKGAKFCLECGTKVEKIANNMVKCPECGNMVVKGKFCPECGHKFLTNCPKCGAPIHEGAKFCLECGEKL